MTNVISKTLTAENDALGKSLLAAPQTCQVSKSKSGPINVSLLYYPSVMFVILKYTEYIMYFIVLVSEIAYSMSL